MPRMGFEPTTQASERSKTIHALDRVATVMGNMKLRKMKPHTSGKQYSL
jgi:hypothetical protein